VDGSGSESDFCVSGFDESSYSDTRGSQLPTYSPTHSLTQSFSRNILSRLTLMKF
jgi:hypothetical protein